MHVRANDAWVHGALWECQPPVCSFTIARSAFHPFLFDTLAYGDWNAAACIQRRYMRRRQKGKSQWHIHFAVELDKTFELVCPYRFCRECRAHPWQSLKKHVVGFPLSQYNLHKVSEVDFDCMPNADAEGLSDSDLPLLLDNLAR